MPLKDLIVSDVSDVFLSLDDFAETVLRYAGGDRSKASSFTAIVTWRPSDVAEQRGKGYVRRADMLVSATQSIDVNDAIKIGAIRCEVQWIEIPDDGSKLVHLVYYEPDAKGVKKAGDL